MRKILEHGGLSIPSSSLSTNEEEDPLIILEAWLGMPESASRLPEVDDVMEDAAPFSKEFYQSLEDLLIYVWKSDSSDEPKLYLRSNPFLDLDCSPNDTSIAKALSSVRVTRLLRFWLDLNVLGNNIMLEDAEDGRASLSRALLHNASIERTRSGHASCRLLHAIYHHVEELPLLQSQLHFYTQSLMRGDRSSWTSGLAISDTQSRLAVYKQTQDITTKLNKEWDDHIDDLEYIIGEWYEMGSSDMRRQARMHLGSVWAQFVARSGGGAGGGVKMENTTSAGIRMSLRILHRILKGTPDHLERSHEHLLKYHLIPLHRPNSLVLWRDQTSILELYHEPLVQCIAILLQRKTDLIPTTISALLDPEVWSMGGNTPKLVLLLHEIDTYIGILPSTKSSPNILGDTLPVLLRTIGGCMASDHSRLAERALAFVKTKNFLSLVLGNFESSLNIMLPFLVRTEPSWNPTVRKMTYNVLKILQDYDSDRFFKACDRIFPSKELVEPQPNLGSADSTGEGTAILSRKDYGEGSRPENFSLQSAMGDWRPPGSAPRRPGSSLMPPPSSRAPRIVSGKPPPLGVTGIAPWSINSAPSRTSQRPRHGARNPPLGVTGVAPWAIHNKLSTGGKRPAETPLSNLSEEMLKDEHPKPKSRVLSFMEQIKPVELEEGVSSWSKAQMAETPTLLPKLKFHDLVFGHDLGSGAFGSVRYARLIDRSRTRSRWPEYAVKIISTDKIKELGYEASVQREVAVLRVLSHPGIARLVSSFRFREGVYLVLEYASGGDLHSLLRKNGSLDHASTRFVMGEVVAALASIHDIGLVYSDLKPENIVITESGHIKLTDFGGCRPVTSEAKKMVQTVATNLLQEMRDGGWKSERKTKTSLDMEEDSEETVMDDTIEVDMQSDLRIEGTTAYLPPEVVLGSFPTLAADSWALGCVIYQCLSGRPPLLEADESSTKNRIVSFDAPRNESALFDGVHAAAIESNARSLIINLLNRSPEKRPSMQRIARDEFFTEASIEVFSLYTKAAPPLDVGDSTPVPDAQWSRRQFSSIWAPQPQAYDVSLQSDDHDRSLRGLSTSAIEEGPEATAFFSKSMNPHDLSNETVDAKPPIQKRSIAEEE